MGAVILSSGQKQSNQEVERQCKLLNSPLSLITYLEISALFIWI